MLRQLNKYKYAVISAVIVLLAGCATIYNPATQRNETLLIDTANEVSLGRNMDQELQSQLEFLNDPEMLSRLNQIGLKIAAVSDRQDLTYYFKIIKDKDLNAMTLPGGYIYVNSGLIEKANDDELAGVIAHEVGHVAARHTAKKLESVLGYQLIMGIALGATGSGSQPQTMAQAIDTVFNLSMLGYGRQDELLADKLAVKYTRRAKFSPYGVVTFFQELKKEADASGENTKLVFLSSHPPIDERIRLVEEEIRKPQ